MLADGTNRYLYGMGRIAQQTPNGLQYFLPDALGSARQLTNAAGALALVQSFDPYGGLHSSQGSTATPYGFTGEWGDASGLLYLRARYYLPQAGIFTSRDPFPGFTTLPVTMQPYLYAAGNPLRYTDPSGEIIPFLIAAGLGGLISGGIDLGTQLLAMHPQSLSQALRCVNWGEVGIAFAGGAVAGLTGFTIFGATTALLGTGFFANVAAGTISGVVAGQYARLTGLVLSGQMSQIGKVLFQPQDMLLDSVLGGAFAGIGYGVGRLASASSTTGDLTSVGATCSFSEDTPVATGDGEKPIGEIQVGDEVLAYDEQSQTSAYYPVTAKFAHLDTDMVTLTIDGEKIETTPEHPFFTKGFGWVPAGDLRAGAKIRKADGSSGIVEKIELEQSGQIMFNLTVDKAHTFYVGENEWLVHNECPIQLPTRNPGDRTRGILDVGTDLIDLISGRNGPASQMPPDTPGMIKGFYIRDHVEAHAAAIMRQQGIEEATLYINNSPCLGPAGCNTNLPHMLPENSRLHVYTLTPSGDSWNFFGTFIGLPDSAWRWP